MRLETFHGSPQELEADLLVLVLDPYTQLFEIEDEGVNQTVERLRQGFDSGELRREVTFSPEGLENVSTAVVYSSQTEKGFTLSENLKTFVSRALALGADTGRHRVAVALNTAEGAALLGAAAEGAVIGTYAFEKYLKEPKDRFAGTTLLLWGTDPEADQEALDANCVVGEAVNFARDLVNEPGSVLTPEGLAQRAREMAERHSFEFEVWDEKRLEEEKCTGILAVGRGSEHPPRLIRLAYTPVEESQHHLVLLGKGVTFDSGGISIKPSDKLHLMRGDMGGAAAVLGAMEAIGKLHPAVRVTCLVVSAENAPDGRSYRPGDILVYRNGKSVHVENTDAEGRLCLADGLLTAGDLGATHLIDVATLTGACARALGPSFTGVMGSSRALVNAITRAGGNRGESYWKFPLPVEYKQLLKSDVADVNNIGGPAAGQITAGLFLQEFVPQGVAWAHLDIAGTFWKQQPWKYYAEGPSGTAVKTLVDLALNWEDHVG